MDDRICCHFCSPSDRWESQMWLALVGWFTCLRCHDGVLQVTRWRGPVHHRVGIFDAHAICTEVLLHDVHDGVICISGCPVALQLEHRRQSCDRLCACLNHPLHRIVMVELAYITAAIFNNVHFVSVANSLNCWHC